jgi:formamidopyrimidine-DNA glycosylase
MIRDAELRRPRLAPGLNAENFASGLRKTRILKVARRGKNILVGLDNGFTLLTHLRMSGRFMHLSGEHEDPKFAHAIFHFDDGSRLIFDDQRHFGLMKLLRSDAVGSDASVMKLAPEPFSDEFCPEFLQQRLSGSGRSLKEFLLDQSKVCGLGNIYASEVMFLTGLSPRRRARNVPRSKLRSLHQNIRSVLQAAIDEAGAAPPHPFIVGAEAYAAESSPNWNVYDREGGPCRACGSPIRRIRQAGRSTYFCPKCQR